VRETGPGAKCNKYNTEKRHIDCRSYPTCCAPAVARLSARRLRPVVCMTTHSLVCITSDTLQTADLLCMTDKCRFCNIRLTAELFSYRCNLHCPVCLLIDFQGAILVCVKLSVLFWDILPKFLNISKLLKSIRHRCCHKLLSSCAWLLFEHFSQGQTECLSARQCRFGSRIRAAPRPRPTPIGLSAISRLAITIKYQLSKDSKPCQHSW